MMSAKFERKVDGHGQLQGHDAGNQQRHEREQDVANPTQGDPQQQGDCREREDPGLDEGAYYGGAGFGFVKGSMSSAVLVHCHAHVRSSLRN
jgi:hypothetical protein